MNSTQEQTFLDAKRVLLFLYSNEDHGWSADEIAVHLPMLYQDVAAAIDFLWGLAAVKKAVVDDVKYYGPAVTGEELQQALEDLVDKGSVVAETGEDGVKRYKATLVV